MRIAVLTSSRADFGIYMPLLNKFRSETKIELKIIAFGSHVSTHYGYTIDEIRSAGFDNIDEIKSLLASDDEVSISSSYGLTALKFAEYWSANKYDLVFCLGDRFEMAAAVNAGIPFNINYAHIHGGETTLGAIDNIYRHQITLASKYHFTSTEVYKDRVISLLESGENVFSVGALSLDGVENIAFPEEKSFREQYDIPDGDYLLVTFHPETIDAHSNESYAREMYLSLLEISANINVVITMPNSDTFGSIYRSKLSELYNAKPGQIRLIESFGKKNYFAAMKYSRALVGNTSSGIIEAASFGKYVVNVGDRQRGRAQSDNMINCSFSSDEIVSAALKVISIPEYAGGNVYCKEDTAQVILDTIKKFLNEKL